MRSEVYPVSLLCITRVNIDSTDLMEYMENIQKQIVYYPSSTTTFNLVTATRFDRLRQSSDH